jgi:cell division protein FtsI (penicillin-binding protein 3)
VKTRINRRRVAFSFAVIVIIAGFFVMRLIDIQITGAAAYNVASYGKMSIPETLFGSRGDIVDSVGTVLATERTTYDVTVSPRNAKEFSRTTDTGEVDITPQMAAQEIAAITGQSADAIIAVINDALAENPNSDFAYVVKGVNVDAFNKIRALEIPWIYFERNPDRAYPNGAVAGNLLGYVGSDGTPLAGIELGSEECLGGVNGSQSYARGADGVRIPGSTVVTNAAKNGSTLKLTIDSDLQWFAQQALATTASRENAKWGMTVVIEVETGRLLVVADYPTFDPNNIDAYPKENLGSRAFTSPYEPGSTMKSLTAASIVDAGLVDPTTPIYSPQYMEFDNGARFSDYGPHPTNLTLQGVLGYSSNTGIAQLGALLDPERRYDSMAKFGMGQTTAVEFPGESPGLLRSWDQWDNQSYYTMFFGQGLTLTAIQMASAYAAIGNDGVRQPVSLIDSCTDENGNTVKPSLPEPVPVVSAQTARTTVDMLENVVRNGWLADFLTIPGYRIAAKTGTAEQSDGAGGYSDKYIVSLAAMFPADDPKFVVLTSLASPDTNKTAVIVSDVNNLMKQIIKTRQIQPSSGEPVDYPDYY